VASLFAQQGNGEATPATNGAADALECAIIGASLSAGFVDGPLTGGDSNNRTVPLQAVVRGWLRDADAETKVRSAADLMMFRDPKKKGPQQIERSLAREPDLVLALDFLFWYAYGHMWLEDGTEEEARLARLEQGLADLARFECPLILGDLPDMKGAARRMIRASQIPSPETLEKLNARIAAWAAERPNVVLFPVRREVSVMKEKGIELPLEGGKFQSPPGSMLQGDRLHPNRLGMAWVGYLLQKQIANALGEAWGDRLPEWTIDDFVELCGAEDDLEVVESIK
ncbi:MAG: hypothetical protein VYE77_05955, partial [Planctomycetota bacterium]|nr:hypothetical protein [Planctomycetota bacterium]